LEKKMICLDTNYLIRGVTSGTSEAARLIAWHRSGEQLLAAAPAWYEFLCGPVTEPQVATMRAFLKAGISGFGEIQAFEAARLFNAVGRTRRLRVDSMIAATAIVAGASLATSNRNDFHPFVSFGLKLVKE
jgi:predicted nucleic acid-binding protein